MAALETLKKTYVYAALSVFHGALLLAILWPLAGDRLLSTINKAPRPDEVLWEKFGPKVIMGEYGDGVVKSPDQMRLLLEETWARPYVYVPWVEFAERPIAGQFVNVSEDGYRHVRNQCAWPAPDGARTIFVFGGSTTFGYGVADADTVPSFLQELLRGSLGDGVCVYNFGRGNYFFRQEAMLLHTMLMDGHRPDAAVFLDGLNDLMRPQDIPELYPRLFDDIEKKAMADLRGWRAGLTSAALQGATEQSSVLRAPESRDVDAIAAAIVARLHGQRKLLTAEVQGLGIPVLFALHPVPYYAYGFENYAFSKGTELVVEAGYHQLMRQDPRADLLTTCAAVAPPSAGMYVDAVHFSPRLARLFAECLRPAVAALLAPPKTSIGSGLGAPKGSELR